MGLEGNWALARDAVSLKLLAVGQIVGVVALGEPVREQGNWEPLPTRSFSRHTTSGVAFFDDRPCHWMKCQGRHYPQAEMRAVFANY